MSLEFIVFLFSPETMTRFDVSNKRLRSLHINPIQTDEFCISGLDKYEIPRVRSHEKRFTRIMSIEIVVGTWV
jgi:hypothetical protein